MPFSKKTWYDGMGGGTPITADELNRMENGIGAAVAFADAAPAAYSPLGGNAAILMQRLSLGVENASMLVLGDSTGVIAAEPWPLRVARWLAAQFPAYTVNYRVWSDAGQAYLALGAATTYPSGTEPQTSSLVVQTGTGAGNAGGPFVLDVYNGSVSGSKADYPRATTTRWAALTAGAPQLVMVNYGHNNTGAKDSTYRGTHYALCRAIQQQLPEAGVVQVAQNPRGTADVDRANDLIRARVVMSLASSEGYGLVNVTQRFLADPAYTANLLLGDGLHPNEAGLAAWTDEVLKHLALGLRSTPRGPYNRAVEVFVPAAALALLSGTATLGPTNGTSGPVGWSLPSGARTDLVTSFVPPESWSQFDVDILWTYGTGDSTKTVAWHPQYRSEGLAVSDVQADNGAAAASGWSNPIASPNYTKKTTVTFAGANPTVSSQLVGSLPVLSRPMGIRIARRGDATADDTYGSAVFLLGVRFIRAR